MQLRRQRRFVLTLLGPVLAVVMVACGTPTATPTPQPTPTSAPLAATSGQATPSPTASPTPAFDAAAYFSGQTIQIVVPASPGGTHDLHSRLLGQHLSKHLPGAPGFVVQNLPGAGGERAVRSVATSDPDGFTIGLSQTRFFKREITGVDVPDFDIDAIRILGTPTYKVGFSSWCVRRSIATNWNEVQQLGRPLTDGQTERGATAGLGPEFVQWTGGPITVVYGYGGSSEVVAAVDRGELDGTSRCFDDPDRLYPEWFEEQYMAPVFWWSNPIPDEWLQRWGVEQPPYILDIVDTSDSAKRIFETTVDINGMSRVFFMPGGVPDEVYNAWTSAFADTINDPEYQEAAAAAGEQTALGTAEDIKRSLDTVRAMSPEDLALFVEIAGVD